jgi:hypothetical protein
MKDNRAAIYVGVAIGAVLVLGLVVMRGSWEEWAPWPVRWHIGALAAGLTLGVFLWLRRPPSFLRPGGGGGYRRRRRLRDRYRDSDGD